MGRSLEALLRELTCKCVLMFNLFSYYLGNYEIPAA
jgi:hypothetical protein